MTTKLFSPIPNRHLAPLLNDALDPSVYPKLASPWDPEQEGVSIMIFAGGRRSLTTH